MKKILNILLFILIIKSTVYAESPFVEDNSNTSNSPTNQGLAEIDYSIDLEQIQKSILKKKNPNTILNIKYEQNKSYKIRTRQNIESLIVFHNDVIAYSFLGNDKAFMKREFKVKKYDFSNMLSIKPILIGVDTNLTVIGESGNIYNFHIYSTDFKNKKAPNALIFVSETLNIIEKLEIRNIEKEDYERKNKTKIEKIKALEVELKILQKKEDEKYLKIGKGISSIKILRKDIVSDFVQEGEESLKSFKIFRDKKFTYFKYDAKEALTKFPNIYIVNDGYDSPTNTRVVGNYIIVETIAESFTLRLGDKYVCVRRLEDIKNEK